MGTIGGFAAWFSLAFKSAFALVGIGIFATLLSPGFTELQTKLVAIFFCIVFTAINIRGAKHTGKTQIVLVIGLLSLLVFYIVVGFFFIHPSNFDNFAPHGFNSIFSTAGLIFISFGGLTKICSVAEECKKPGRNIPLGMFLSWGIISLLYLLVIFVTIGVMNPETLKETLTPISDGAGVFGGNALRIVISIGAFLAFISTANAGIMAASRYPLGMSRDKLLPPVFQKISSKFGTPYVAILFTGTFILAVFILLKLELLVKVASSVLILLYIFANLTLILFRESKIFTYRPKFYSPLYPYLQIFGILTGLFLLIEMGSSVIFLTLIR